MTGVALVMSSNVAFAVDFSLTGVVDPVTDTLPSTVIGQSSNSNVTGGTSGQFAITNFADLSGTSTGTAIKLQIDNASISPGHFIRVKSTYGGLKTLLPGDATHLTTLAYGADSTGSLAVTGTWTSSAIAAVSTSGAPVGSCSSSGAACTGSVLLDITPASGVQLVQGASYTDVITVIASAT